MSNIYDALNKGKAEPRSPVAQGDPLKGGQPLPARPRARGRRDQELEDLKQRILLELDPGETCQIAFAGAVPGEGASTLALLFARSLAETEQRSVLLVDADLRGFPQTLSGALKDAAGGAGLVDVLDRRVDLADVVRATEQRNLHFLPCGTVDAAPADAISRESFARFRREAEKHYAFVVVDLAPLLLAPESGTAASACHGTVVVVRAHRTRREIVQKGIQSLRKVQCKVLGVILNERRYPIPGFLYRRL